CSGSSFSSNSTSPPAYYTLSLHDALPIYRKVGEIISSLKEEGLWDNTIVFYYGDNGGVLPRSKRFMYESGLRIPLVVRVPEKYQDRKSTRLNSSHVKISYAVFCLKKKMTT